jgi:hypothetical protein
MISRQVFTDVHDLAISTRRCPKSRCTETHVVWHFYETHRCRSESSNFGKQRQRSIYCFVTPG